MANYHFAPEGTLPLQEILDNISLTERYLREEASGIKNYNQRTRIQNIAKTAGLMREILADTQYAVSVDEVVKRWHGLFGKMTAETITDYVFIVANSSGTLHPTN